MAATKSDLLDLFESIRSQMASKTDIARLQWEVTLLRAETEAQRNQLRCMRTDVVNLRAEVEDMRTKVLEEVCDGFGDIKEEVLGCCMSTHQEIWSEGKQLQKKVEEVQEGIAKLADRGEEITRLADVEDAIARLTMRDERRDEDVEEMNNDSLRIMDRIEKVDEKVKVLAEEFEATKKDSDVSSSVDEKRKRRTRGLWFADGY